MRSGLFAQFPLTQATSSNAWRAPACRWADTALAKGGPMNLMRYVWPVNAKLPARVR
jgi:hypothetical protein